METMTSHSEGQTAKAIESETSQLPSDYYLWTGLTILGVSFMLFTFRQKHAALMVGQLASPLLIMGVYNKLVKQSGHDFLDPLPE